MCAAAVDLVLSIQNGEQNLQTFDKALASMFERIERMTADSMGYDSDSPECNLRKRRTWTQLQLPYKQGKKIQIIDNARSSGAQKRRHATICPRGQSTLQYLRSVS